MISKEGLFSGSTVDWNCSYNSITLAGDCCEERNKELQGRQDVKYSIHKISSEETLSWIKEGNGRCKWIPSMINYKLNSSTWKTKPF